MSLLLRDVNLEGLDHGDLDAIFLEHFHSGSGPDLQTVEYGRQGNPAAVVLKYSKDGNLLGVFEGAGLEDEDISAIGQTVEREKLAAKKREVARELVFSSLPLEGFWSHLPDFQILPLPPDARRAEMLLTPHPFIIEHSVKSCESSQIWHNRRSRGLRKWTLLLNVLLDVRIYPQDGVARSIWVYVNTGDGQLNAESRQEGYSFPGFSPRSQEFSSTAQIQPAPIDAAAEYWGELGKSHMSVRVSDIMPDLMRLFLALAPSDRERFLRAAYWFRQASRRSQSQSASYVATITALESLLPPHESSPTCPVCGLETGKSISKRFSEMLERLAPGGGQLAKDRQRLYSIRSKLAHGNSLLHSDADSAFYLHPRQSQEWRDSDFALRLTKVSLVNWLLQSSGTQLGDA